MMITACTHEDNPLNANLIKKFWNPQIFGVDRRHDWDAAYWPAEHGFQTVGRRPSRINFQSPPPSSSSSLTSWNFERRWWPEGAVAADENVANRAPPPSNYDAIAATEYITERTVRLMSNACRLPHCPARPVMTGGLPLLSNCDDLVSVWRTDWQKYCSCRCLYWEISILHLCTPTYTPWHLNIC